MTWRMSAKKSIRGICLARIEARDTIDRGAQHGCIEQQSLGVQRGIAEQVIDAHGRRAVLEGTWRGSAVAGGPLLQIFDGRVCRKRYPRDDGDVVLVGIVIAPQGVVQLVQCCLALDPLKLRQRLARWNGVLHLGCDIDCTQIRLGSQLCIDGLHTSG